MDQVQITTNGTNRNGTIHPDHQNQQSNQENQNKNGHRKSGSR
jgi:hypothetical protein